MLFCTPEIRACYFCEVAGACGQLGRLQIPEQHLVEPSLRTPELGHDQNFYSSVYKRRTLPYKRVTMGISRSQGGPLTARSSFSGCVSS